MYSCASYCSARCRVLYATGADAQAVYGSLVGNVTDTTGGAIPGATVTATHTQTNLTREVVTNASGAYSIPNIPSGTYQVVVAVPGFQTFTARDVIVTNRDARVDARLGLGTLEEALHGHGNRPQSSRPRTPPCSTLRTASSCRRCRPAAARSRAS